MNISITLPEPASTPTINALFDCVLSAISDQELEEVILVQRGKTKGLQGQGLTPLYMRPIVLIEKTGFVSLILTH